MHRNGSVARIGLLLAVFMALALFQSYANAARAADNSRSFSETGHTVSGKFLDYWEKNGGLPVFGYPITDAAMEVDPETGQTFLTQWFERNRFELHPENAGTRFEVLLGLLGKDLRREALAVDPDFQRTGAVVDYSQPKEQQWYFAETGHNLRFGFLKYWQENGGLERFGYPISEQHTEIDSETGNPYVTQWFERARFEYHPENQPPYDILLGLLGNQLKAPKSKAEYQWKIGGSYNRFFRPGGVGVDGQGNVYLPDTLNSRILKFDSNGTLLEVWGGRDNREGQFNLNPGSRGFAVDKQGNVYLAGDSLTILKFDNHGRFVTRWGGYGSGDGHFSGGILLAADSQGNIFAIDNASFQIQKFDSNGRFLGKWGSFGNRDDQFSKLADLATDNQGNVYLVDFNLLNQGELSSKTLIKKFDGNGHFLTRWATEASYPVSGLTVDGQGNVYLGGFDRPYHFRVDKYDSAGHLVTKLGTAATGDVQFSEIGGLAVDSQNNFYVADFYNNRIQKFDSGGKFLLKWGTPFDAPGWYPPDPVAGPTGVALNRQANLYVADPGNGRIQKFDGNGKFLLQFGSKGTGDGQFGNSDGSPVTSLSIAIDSLGFVYVVDNGNYRIQKFDSNGNFLLKWGGQGNGDGQFGDDRFPGGPQGIAVDSKGNVYVADNANSRIQKFDSNGRFLFKWGSVGGLDGQFAYPWAVAVDAQDNVYVADDFRIQKFDSEGEFLGKFGNGGRALATDGQNRLYVAGTRNNRVWVFDSNGNFLFDWGGQGSGDGQFSQYVTGIATDKFDRVYVADTQNNRIQKFRLR